MGRGEWVGDDGQDIHQRNYQEKINIENMYYHYVLNKAKYLEKNIPVFDIFLESKSELQIYFDEFFPDILLECKKNFKLM